MADVISANFLTSPRPTYKLSVESCRLNFNKPSRWSWCKLKLRTHCLTFTAVLSGTRWSAPIYIGDNWSLKEIVSFYRLHNYSGRELDSNPGLLTSSPILFLFSINTEYPLCARYCSRCWESYREQYKLPTFLDLTVERDRLWPQQQDGCLFKQ